jgi:hypothetical protein
MRSRGEHNKFPARRSKADPANEQAVIMHQKYRNNKHTQFLTGIKEEYTAM